MSCGGIERVCYGRDNCNWRAFAGHCGNLVEWNISGIHVGDPNEDSY